MSQSAPDPTTTNEELQYAAAERESDAVTELAAARVAVDELSSQLEHLATKDELAAERGKRRRLWIPVALLVLFSLIVGAGVLRLNSLASGLAENSDVNRRNGDLIRECVTPAEKKDGETDQEFAGRIADRCFEESQARTAEAVLRLNCASEKDHREIIELVVSRFDPTVPVPRLPAACQPFFPDLPAEAFKAE